MTIARSRAEELVAAFPRQRILVVGDLMLDRYIIGSVTRISPEAPVPVVHVRQEKAVPGGSANVAWNVVALGGQSTVAGMLGRDASGRELANLLKQRGVRVGEALENVDHPTTVKTRILADRQQIVRVDWEEKFSYSKPLMDAFLAHLRDEVASSTGVVLADYGKGVLDQQVVDLVLAAARERGIPVSLDPKNFELNLDGLTFATPNRKEAFGAVQAADSPPAANPLEDRALLDVGSRLLEKWRPQQLMITLGGQGMLLLVPGQTPRHVPTRAREVFDVSGAGDTVIATCTLALAAGARFDEAAELANWAAGVVVGKLGTATCSPGELLSYLGQNAGEGRGVAP